MGNDNITDMLSSVFEKLRIPHAENKIFGIALLSIFVTPLLFIPNLVDNYEGPRLIFLLLLLGSCLIYLAFQSELAIYQSKKLIYLLISFFGVCLIATLFSLDVSNSIVGGNLRHADSLLFILCWVMLTTLYCFVNRPLYLTVLYRVWIIIGLLTASLGILHSFGIGFYAGLDNTTRAIIPGFEGNQNFSAMLVVGILPFILPLANQAKTRIGLWLYIATGFIMIWALMVFASRGSIIALAISLVIGLGLLFLKKFIWKIRLAVVLALLASVLLATLFYTSTRIPGIDSSLNLQSDSSTANRIEIWVQSVNSIQQHPLTGLGFSNYILGFLSWGNTTFSNFEVFDDAHNLFLHLATSVGLPALIIFLAIIGHIFWRSVKNYWNSQSLFDWAIIVGLIAILVSFCFNPVTIAHWLLLGFLLAASQASTAVPLILKLGRVAKIGLIVGGVILFTIGLWLLSSLLIQHFAEQAYRNKQYQKAEKIAHISSVVNPFNSAANLYAAQAMIKQQADPNLVRQEIDLFKRFHTAGGINNTTSATLYFVLYKYSQDPADLVQSFEDLEMANLLQPNNVLVMTRHAYFAYLVEDYDLAEEQIKLALSYNNQNLKFSNLLLLAQIYLKQDRKEAMYNTLKKANNIAPTPLIEKAIEEYEQGKFNRDKVPVHFPEIDI